MKIHFWGASGSIPSPLSAEEVRRKLFEALKRAKGHPLQSESDILRFIDNELPFSVSGTYGGNTSCVEIQSDQKETILLDAGSGLRDFSDAYMHSGRGHQPRVFHIFMSHYHWDHIQGFPFFTPAYIPGNKIIFHVLHDCAEATMRDQMRDPWFPVRYEYLKASIEFVHHIPGQPFECQGFHIRTIEQDHPGVSYGFRFEKDGKSFVYSTDSEHKEAAYRDDYPFIEFFRQADLLVFDAQYTFADATYNKANWGHSSNIMAVDLSARAQVNHLVIFHHEPSSTDESLEEYLFNTRLYADLYYSEADPRKEKPRFPRKISLAFDGMEVKL